MTFYNGSQIIPTNTYRGVTVDFLLNGGDDFKDVIGKVYTVKGKVELGAFRENIKPELIEMGIITEKDVIDPKNPRMVIDHV